MAARADERRTERGRRARPGGQRGLRVARGRAAPESADTLRPPRVSAASLLPELGRTKSEAVGTAKEQAAAPRRPRPGATRVPVGDGREAEQQGAEERDQLLLQLLPHRRADVVRLLPCLRLGRNQQVEQRVRTLENGGKRRAYSPTKPRRLLLRVALGDNEGSVRERAAWAPAALTRTFRA